MKLDSKTVLIYIEHDGSKIKKNTLELITAVKKAAPAVELYGILLCVPSSRAKLCAEIEKLNLKKVFVIENNSFSVFCKETFALAVKSVIDKLNPALSVFSHTANSSETAKMLASRTGVALICDSISFAACEDGEFVALHPMYAGKIRAHVKFENQSCGIVTLRPNVVEVCESASGSCSEFETVEFTPQADNAVKILNIIADASKKIDLSEADIIVAGGRGVGSKENFKVIEELAAAINGVVGASRAAVDAGWRDHHDQVGQTGKIVNPKIYIACGISGAIQHTVGMQTARCIIAINKDPEANIFKIADYGIVGDLFQVVPQLASEIKTLINA